MNPEGGVVHAEDDGHGRGEMQARRHIIAFVPIISAGECDEGSVVGPSQVYEGLVVVQLFPDRLLVL